MTETPKEDERVVADAPENAVPEISDDVERVLLFALREARQTMSPAPIPKFEDLDPDTAAEFSAKLGVSLEDLPAALEQEAHRQAEARTRMVAGDSIMPFTVLEIKSNYFIETHPGESDHDCYKAARRTVEGARGATAYALCYDGYVETDGGTRDALIAEGGAPGDEVGVAVGLLYKRLGASIIFENEPCYIGEAPNFMEKLKDSAQYTDTDIDERYLDPDAFNSDEDEA